MRTEAQIEASRINGAKSHGPVTEEGKAASSRNAIRHGLLSQTIVVTGESDERFHDQLSALIDEYRPQTETEVTLVEKMAVARWRQLSVWGLQTAGLSNQICRQTEDHPEAVDKEPAVRAFLAMNDVVGRLNALNRYDVSFDRAYFRALEKLTELQKQRISKQTREGEQILS